MAGLVRGVQPRFQTSPVPSSLEWGRIHPGSGCWGKICPAVSLKRLFGSKLRADLLAVLLLLEQGPVHVRALAEMVGGHSTNVSREVKMLAEEGIVSLSRAGRKVIVQALHGDPLVEALRLVVSLGSDPQARLAREIEPLGLRVKESLPLDEEGMEVLVLVSGPDRPEGLDALVAEINATSVGPKVQARWVWEAGAVLTKETPVSTEA